MSACAGTLPRPSACTNRATRRSWSRPDSATPRRQKALRWLAPTTAAEGVDLYGRLPDARRPRGQPRGSSSDSFANRLDRYRRLHVFAFLAGAWTMNPLLERQLPANLASVIYDRSPFRNGRPPLPPTVFACSPGCGADRPHLRRRENPCPAVRGAAGQGGASGGVGTDGLHQESRRGGAVLRTVRIRAALSGSLTTTAGTCR